QSRSLPSGHDLPRGGAGAVENNRLLSKRTYLPARTHCLDGAVLRSAGHRADGAGGSTVTPNLALCWSLARPGPQRESGGCPLTDGLGASLAFRATQSLNTAA